MPYHKNIFLHIILALFLFVVSFLVRYSLYTDINIRTEGRQFSRESALFVFYGEKMLKGEPLSGQNPAILNKGEFLDPEKTYSLFSVKVLTGLYKHLPGMAEFSLESFTSVAGQLVYSLVPVFVFLVILRITGSSLASLTGGLFSSFSRMAILRTLAVDFMKEIYALPLMALSFLFTLWVLSEKSGEKKQRISFILAGLCLGLSLLIWDMTRLYIFSAAVALLILYCVTPQKRIKYLLYSLLLFPLIFSFFDIYARAHAYITFPVNGILIALPVLSFLERKKGLKQSIRLGLFFLVLFSCILFLRTYNSNYSHFFNLLFYKCKFLNKKPFDSAALPYETRLLWTPALHSVHWKSFVEFYLGPLLIAVFGLLSSRRKNNRITVSYIGILCCIIYPLSILFFRLIVFNAWLLPVGIGLAVYTVTLSRRKWLKIVLLALIMMILSCELQGGLSPSFRNRYTENLPYKKTRSLTDWIRLYTDRESLFLANFTLTPSILHYGQRSIVTQPKYEDAESRKIIKDYIFTLFGDSEKEFHRFCLENHIDYFVFSMGTYNDRSINAFRYMAGKEKKEQEQSGSAAFLFERGPRHLKMFGQCYENGKYRVFRVLSQGSMKRSSFLFQRAMKIFQKDKKSEEGLKILYEAYLNNPQNLAVYILLRGKQKILNNESLIPHVD